jgi:hypothetical protein
LKNLLMHSRCWNQAKPAKSCSIPTDRQDSFACAGY